MGVIAFFLCLRRPPTFTLFPYTTLFRSVTFPISGGSTHRARRTGEPMRGGLPVRAAAAAHPRTTPRSEEHTSELQSLRHLVCRLLLEKKKKNELDIQRTLPDTSLHGRRG